MWWIVLNVIKRFCRWGLINRFGNKGIISGFDESYFGGVVGFECLIGVGLNEWEERNWIVRI